MRSGPPPSPFPSSQTSRPPAGAAPSQPGQHTSSSSATHIPSWAYQAATALSLLVGITAIVRGTSAISSIQDSDLTNFFLKSAEYVLQGNPWQMYAVHGSGVTSSYPNYNPPLSILLLAPLLGLAQALGLASSYGQVITFVTLPFILLVPLLGYLTLRVLRMLYPEAPETLRFLAFLLVTLSPLTWQTYGTWYHVEQPLMLCFLIGSVWALQTRREGLAGALAGLAFLSRTTALIPLIAVGVMLLTEKEWRGLLKFGGVSALVTAVGLGPFFLFDPHDTIHSLITWRGTAPIGGNSIWTIFATSSTSGLRHDLDALARRLDMYTVILVVAIVAFFAVRRLRISAYSRDAWAILAIAALTVPMLSKTNWPYYYLEPFFFILIWEFSSMHDRLPGVWRWPLLTVGYLAITATLSQYIGLRSVGALDRVSVGFLEFVAMLAVAGAIWLRIPARKVVGGPASMTGRSPAPMGRAEQFAPGFTTAGTLGVASAVGSEQRGRGFAPPQPPASPIRPPLPRQGGSPGQDDARGYAMPDEIEGAEFGSAQQTTSGGRWRQGPLAPQGDLTSYRDDSTPRRGNRPAPARGQYAPPDPQSPPSTPLWPADPNQPFGQGSQSGQLGQSPGDPWSENQPVNGAGRGAGYPSEPGNSGAGRRPRPPDRDGMGR